MTSPPHRPGAKTLVVCGLAVAVDGIAHGVPMSPSLTPAWLVPTLLRARCTHSPSGDLAINRAEEPSDPSAWWSRCRDPITVLNTYPLRGVVARWAAREVGVTGG